jgi:uncharacterized membrane protein
MRADGILTTPWRRLWAVLALGVLLALPTARAADAEASVPVVRALLFYGEPCPDCGVLFEYLIPALRERYGPRLEMGALDASAPEAAPLYQSAVGGAPPSEALRLPAAVVGAEVLLGLDAIATTLGDGFEALAARPDASRWPALPGLSGLLPDALGRIEAQLARMPTAEPQAAAPGPADRDRVANALAVVVLVGMVLALVHSVVRARRPGRHAPASAWLVPLAALVGIGVSAYTGYTSLAGVAPVCGPIGSCDLVQASEYAKLFGIPLGVLGVLGYGAVLAAWAAGRRLSPRGGGWRWLPWAIAFVGVVFSIRLTALEPFVIGHTCLWCLASAVTMSALLWIVSGETRQHA